MNQKDILIELKCLKTFKSGGVVALHKPLLLLLIFSKIIKGQKDNVFVFDEIEPELTDLLKLYGWKNTKVYRPEYPFVFLGSSKIWESELKPEMLKRRDVPTKYELRGTRGKLDDSVFRLVLESRKVLESCIYELINQFWTEAYHDEILAFLNIDLEYSMFQKRKRSKQFVENVLVAYEKKCAICEQSIRIRDELICIDACHVRPLHANGEDIIGNGIALCKYHHWALDRGAISIDENWKVLISDHISGMKANKYLYSYEGKTLFRPRKRENYLTPENIDWHRKYIFVK